MQRIGLGDRWAYLDMMRNETHGLSRARLDELYRDAAAIVNLCGATAPRDEHRQGARLIYVETDPVVRAAPHRAGRAVVARVPRRARRPLHLRREPREPGLPGAARAVRLEDDPAARRARLLGAADGPAAPLLHARSRRSENKGKDITWQGETYQWSKHINFLRFLDLPRHTPQAFQLAMKPDDPRGRGARAGGRLALVDPEPISRDLDGYRGFIQQSRGEFTVAKDIYVRPRSGWFSDRSVCYLAAGRPVVTQDTGFGKFVPTGSGLFAFSTMEEAVEALARINGDYAAHSAGARRVAAEAFGAEPVLRRFLDDAGLA